MQQTIGYAVLSLAVVLFLPRISMAKELSQDEKKILTYVDSTMMTSGMDLIKQAVVINSGTHNREGVHKVGELFEAPLTKLGFVCDWQDLSSIQRGYHLFAHRKGSPGSLRVLLIGHLDTVFEPTDGFMSIEKIDEKKMRGPGLADMKSGDVMIINTLQALERAGDLDNLDVSVAYLGDEESMGADADGTFTSTRKRLMEMGSESDIALAFEDGVQGIGYVTGARRSYTRWTLKIKAKSGHSSRVFSTEAGAGAIFPLATMISRFYSEVRGEKYLTFNVGNIVGGENIKAENDETTFSGSGKENIIPAEANTLGDLRTYSTQQLKSTKKRMQEIVNSEVRQFNQRHDKKKGAAITADLKFRDSHPAMPLSAGNQLLLRQLGDVSKDLGFGEVKSLDPMLRGGGDISFVASLIDAGLDGLGPQGEGTHSKAETMDVSTLPIATKRVAILLHRLAQPNAWKRLKKR